MLIEASREVFGTLGPDAPLEEIARAAGVSRTTLYRHFATREELAVAVYEENVLAHEAYARSLAGERGGIIAYFDSVMVTLSQHLGITRVMLGAGSHWYRELSDRMLVSFESLLDEGLRDGVVHSWVRIDDIMTALQMADAAFAFDLSQGLPSRFDTVTRLLKAGLFTESA